MPALKWDRSIAGETMNSEGLPVKVYEGEAADVAFLESLLRSAGIERARAGAFFGPGTEVYVSRGDEAAAREMVKSFEANWHHGKPVVIRGPWASK
jgi:hypothetical protein